MLTGQVDIGGISLFLPNVGGLLNGGVLSVIALFISLLFSVMLVVWVVFSIYAGIKIITSAGNPDGIQGGMTVIKNIWIGIAMFLGFLIVLSLIGVFTGVGDIYSWSSNLAQCGGADSEFKFRYIELEMQPEIADDERREYAIACCRTGGLGSDQEWDHLDVSDVPLNEFFRFEDRCENLSYTFL
ncbi:MAG: hypothetical protein TR69_WS6001000808 [candidate division WS6 bacterium OLB20]|uniref:Uncharacterized protein n=1 Tax=candidate division WS6 bacterium OLB20 TaxID=1617426 RepID=A0A136LYW5_9BACT|nr:MAG: hypothetical protein TR69_WS6001000808 [candidate division WS6 bacterium OLB20]